MWVARRDKSSAGYATKDGGWRWLLWSSYSDGRQIYAVTQDITDRKRLEAEREAMLERVDAMARTDSLTGLPNRRAWDEELRRELARAGRHEHVLAVVMLDLDRFKDYNDTHGHQAGDRLLGDIGRLWRVRVRVSDFVARYGGEEFARCRSLNRPGAPRFAAAAQVGRDRPQSGAGQRRHLVAPQTVRVRKPVEQQHGGPVAGVPDREVDTVASDSSHAGEPSRRSATTARRKRSPATERDRLRVAGVGALWRAGCERVAGDRERSC